MPTRLIPILLIALVALAEPTQSRPNELRGTSKQESAKQTTLTGCLDQRAESYVLRSTSDMSKSTRLKGKSFSDDNFARYVGQKVTVQGSVAGDTLEVTKIEKVADTCSS